ncbi:hypothetical protein J4558_03990 [Leptolyngbya sp. 15MV]|nr:hypothetical protein J4558_03990 [Leptolyngbya sp. 15MV]
MLEARDAVGPTLPDTEARKAVLEAIDAGLTRGWAAALEVERRQLVRLRHTPLAKTKLSEFFARGSEGKK